MYCSTCGIDSVEGLKYCKRCGASLSTSEFVPVKKPLVLIALFLLVFASIAALGLTLPLIMARDLINAGFRTKEVMFFFFGSAMATVMIIRILSQALMRMVESRQFDHAKIEQPRTANYEPHQIAQPPSVGSVTEHTTRSFDQRRFDDARFEGR